VEAHEEGELFVLLYKMFLLQLKKGVVVLDELLLAAVSPQPPFFS